MLTPFQEFYIFAFVVITFAVILYRGGKHEISENGKILVLVSAALLVIQEYRVADSRNAFYEFSPSAYTEWMEIKTGPDSD